MPAKSTALRTGWLWRRLCGLKPERGVGGTLDLFISCRIVWWNPIVSWSQNSLTFLRG
jgi:hypothetical protein